MQNLLPSHGQDLNDLWVKQPLGDLFLGMKLGNSNCMGSVWDPLLPAVRFWKGVFSFLLEGMCDWEAPCGSGETEML